MKLLTLVRHAKSDWDNDLSDFDRPLNERGMNDAPKIGDFIAKNLPKVDLIISSPAVRAEQTALTIAEKIGYPEDKIEFVDELYLCSTSEYFEVLMEQNLKLKHIMIVSHNPGTTGFLNMVANENIDNVPTSGVAHIELDIYKWEDIEPGCGVLKEFITPKTI